MGDAADDMFDMAMIEDMFFNEHNHKHNILFNEHNHEYIVDGEIKKSVTGIFKDVGICDYNEVDDYYRDRGTRVHKACALEAQGFLDYATVAEDILPHLNTFKSVIERLKLSYVSAEVPCYDAEYDVCGTYDLIMEQDEKRILVELKTGEFPMWGGLQLAWYERMVRVDDVMGISLKDGKVFIKAPDWKLNHETLEQIHNGTFDLDTWSSDRKRRHMKVLKCN